MSKKIHLPDLKLNDTITIKVTRQHIDSGECGEPGRCAVALAFLEQTTVEGVGVSTEEVECDQSLDTYKTFDFLLHPVQSGDFQDFISDFDSKIPVSPRSFQFKLAVIL